MMDLVPDGSTARSFAFGRISGSLLSLEALPRPIGTIIFHGLNAVALAQPFEIKAICPWLVLKVTKPD
jgi:hypothetical protein